MTSPQTAEADWTPGDPIYQPETVSYDITITRTYEACPPNCWHHHPDSYGHGMRWSPDWPLLRFLPDGLKVSGPTYRGVTA